MVKKSEYVSGSFLLFRAEFGGELPCGKCGGVGHVDTEASAAVLTWTSSDKSVATVSETGLVTAIAKGNTTITVSSGNVSATCEIIVSENGGIDDVLIDENHDVSVYNLQGVRMNVTKREDLSKLPQGFYIVNGKKVFLK